MSEYVEQFPVSPPKIVAIAKEPGLNGTYIFPDKDLPGTPLPTYGEDFEFGLNGKAPNGQDVGSTEAELKPKMRLLLDYFARSDQSGMARRLFDKFLAKQSQVSYFTDKDLDKAVADNDNFQVFCLKAMGAPYPAGAPPAPGKTRIHQALKAANWDINSLVAPQDLGAPVFNLGDKAALSSLGNATGDWANGLGVMIDAVQYVYVIATHYHFSEEMNSYYIKLKFMGYDIFGLDDNDLAKYGAGRKWSINEPAVGITAWWQLQHQYKYAPLITRFVVEKTFAYPAI